jgi:hypothetical protein
VPASALPEIEPHRLDLIVYGDPVPQGSKRHVGHGVMVESGGARLRTWRDDVKMAALRALEMTPSWERNYPAVVGHFQFVLHRPRAHFHQRVGGDVLREDAPYFHTTRPDLDKLLRSTWDALTAAGVYPDDNRLAQVFAIKCYCALDSLERPGLRLTLTGVAR